jgi:hypothetical protein
VISLFCHSICLPIVIVFDMIKIKNNEHYKRIRATKLVEEQL